MPLPGTIESAPDGALGFDANTPVSLTVAQQFAEQGYSFCLRYLSRATTQGSNDLSADRQSAELIGCQSPVFAQSITRVCPSQ